MFDFSDQTFLEYTLSSHSLCPFNKSSREGTEDHKTWITPRSLRTCHTGRKDTKTHMSSLFDMQQNKAFCPILSLLFIIREVSHARTMTHKLALEPFWTSKPLLSIFFNFYFLLINREKKGPRVQDPDFSLQFQRFRGNDPKGPKRVQKGPFFDFCGSLSLFARTIPHKNCVLDPFWTLSAPFFWSKNLGLKSYKCALIEHLLP